MLFVLKSRKHFVVLWTAIVVLLLSNAVQANQPIGQPLKVVTSIKPLALLAKDLLREHAVVETLLPDAADPHHYALKISDVERIKNADWVIWLGPEMEMFLSKLLKDHPGNLALLKALNFDEHLHSEEHHHHGLDPHVWLSPEYVIQIQQIIFQAIAEKVPDTAVALANRKQELMRNWADLEKTMTEQLRPIKNTPFAVNHPAYDYFVEYFGLNQVAVVNPSEETRLSAKKIVELKQRVKNSACLLIETQTSHNEKLGHLLGLRTVMLDPLASGKELLSFEQFYTEFTNSFLRCFKED